MRYVELFHNIQTNHKRIPASENMNSFCPVTETLKRQHRGKRLSGFCSCFDISYWNRKVGWDIIEGLIEYLFINIISQKPLVHVTAARRDVIISESILLDKNTQDDLTTTILIWFPAEKDSLKTSTVKGKRDFRALLKQIATRCNNVNMQINKDTLMGFSLRVKCDNLISRLNQG